MTVLLGKQHEPQSRPAKGKKAIGSGIVAVPGFGESTCREKELGTKVGCSFLNYSEVIFMEENLLASSSDNRQTSRAEQSCTDEQPLLFYIILNLREHRMPGHDNRFQLLANPGGGAGMHAHIASLRISLDGPPVAVIYADGAPDDVQPLLKGDWPHRAALLQQRPCVR
jgi:hypothetical protein